MAITQCAGGPLGHCYSPSPSLLLSATLLVSQVNTRSACASIGRCVGPPLSESAGIFCEFLARPLASP